MELRKWLLGEVIENYDYLRKPLSSMERKSFKGEFPYYGAQGIIDYIADYRCDGEFLLIAEDGENLSSRNAPIAQIAKGKYWVNNHAHIVKNNNNSDLYYICYLLNNSDIAGYITGSAQPKLSQGNLNKIKIALPSLPIQQKIASILSTYDTLIENNNRRIRLLEQMAENLYKEWFVRFRFPGHEKVETENGLPKGWKRTKLIEECQTSSGGTPSRSKSEYYINGTIPWIKTGELQDNILINTEEYITEDAVKHSSAKIFPKGTLLMAMYGVNIGKLGISEIEATCNQACCVFIPKQIDYKYYLYHYFKSIREYLLSISFGAAQQNLSQELIKAIKVIFPNESINTNFVRKIEPLYKKISFLQKQNTLLTRQRDLLLPRLMSGKLEVKP
ncbi:restriction endonuclease [Prevotella intermedia]|uniref:Restriction endonuclease n=1 Tax=Prevotella intermedia TaxID=28131 RepID=A0AAJ3VE17_PREIN|nr:restriction endonuclease subunit S [Prevotella intermedia]PJI18973.1 restriction endonuclease [Prevotella intermedia]